MHKKYIECNKKISLFSGKINVSTFVKDKIVTKNINVLVKMSQKYDNYKLT